MAMATFARAAAVPSQSGSSFSRNELRCKAPRATVVERKSARTEANYSPRPAKPSSDGMKSTSPNQRLVFSRRAPMELNSLMTPVVEDIKETQTDFIAETQLPTHGGLFRVRAYRHWVNGSPTEPLAIIHGDVEGLENVPVRVHDACFTSEVLGSMKCDCAEQLNVALGYIKENGPGVVVYLQQEGRGIGLANKIAAYMMQEEGHDTVDANRMLGLPDDCREYTAVANMIKDLNMKSIKLITNNPRKINCLNDLGVNVAGRISCLIESNEVNDGYLKAKANRMDHMMDPM